MLFSKNIPASCALCLHAVRINGKEMLCDKKGPVLEGYSCRKFKYDPVKRIPEPKLNVKTDYDFNLE